MIVICIIFLIVTLLNFAISMKLFFFFAFHGFEQIKDELLIFRPNSTLLRNKLESFDVSPGNLHSFLLVCEFEDYFFQSWRQIYLDGFSKVSIEGHLNFSLLIRISLGMLIYSLHQGVIVSYGPHKLLFVI